MVTDLAEQPILVVPEAHLPGAATVAHGVGGQFAGHDEQMIDCFLVGTEPAGVRGQGLP
jgi:hypothetical protein